MKKKKIIESRQTITPSVVFEKMLDEIRYSKVKLTKLPLAEAEKTGEGLFKFETVYESIFSGGGLELVPKDTRKVVLGLLEHVKGLCKNDYTEDELKTIAATGFLGATPPRMAIPIDGILKDRKSVEKAFTLAYGFKISLLQQELEDALDKNDIYRACFCCIQIGGFLHLRQMLPLSEAVRQMTGRNKELRWRKRKIPESIADAKKIIDFYNKEKKTFEKQYGTSHGSAKHALSSTCEKFNLGPTSIKKILSIYNNDPLASTTLFEIATSRK